MKDCENLIVWITGAGSGLGEAMALEFGCRGAKVVLSGRRRERLDEVKGKLDGLGVESSVEVCDVRETESLCEVVQRISDRYGRLDIAVANAGYAVGGAFERITIEQWRGQMDTNVIGVVGTIQAAMPALKEVAGRVGVVSSVAGHIATPDSAPYTASKFAVVGLCRSLQMEFANTGVSLTNLMPGFVESDISKVDNDGQFRADYEDKRPKQLMWPREKAARVMVNAIVARKREYVFTGHGKAAAFVGRHLPALVHSMMRHKTSF